MCEGDPYRNDLEEELIGVRPSGSLLIRFVVLVQVLSDTVERR